MPDEEPLPVKIEEVKEKVSEPLPVKIEEVSEPLPVTVDNPGIPTDDIDLTGKPKKSIAESERYDESKLALATRVNRINLIWEYTQTFLACLITVTFVAQTLLGGNIPRSLGNILFLVIGFYFGRTNHARPGGGTPTGGGT